MKIDVHATSVQIFRISSFNQLAELITKHAQIITTRRDLQINIRSLYPEYIKFANWILCFEKSYLSPDCLNFQQQVKKFFCSIVLDPRFNSVSVSKKSKSWSKTVREILVLKKTRHAFSLWFGAYWRDNSSDIKNWNIYALLRSTV